MDVVYLVKEGERNEELRYSLRSLKNVPHDTVHVVGHKPSWVKGVTEHFYDPGMPPGSEKHVKHWKTWRMMRYLVTLDTISDDFILFNDDFYVMSRIDSVPTLHRGPIKGVIDRLRGHTRPSNVYVAAMVETQEVLRSLRKPALCYEMHAPMAINRHQMHTCIEIVDAMSRSGQMHINKRSLYGNYWEIGGEPTEDVKVDSSRPAFDPKATFLSSSDHSFRTREVGQTIKRAFPHESPYEVEGSQRDAANYHRTPRTGRWANVRSRG